MIEAMPSDDVNTCGVAAKYGKHARPFHLPALLAVVYRDRAGEGAALQPYYYAGLEQMLQH